MHKRTEEDERREAAKSIATAILERRSAGEVLPDAVVLDTHRDLARELAEELEFAGQMRLGILAGEKASISSQPEQALSWGALDQPIEWDQEDDDGAAEHIAATPEIPGYVVLEEVGRGGQGRVYRAIQESTDRVVAIKVMAARPGSRYRARIEREAKLLASLRHPHIVSIIERSQASSGQFCLIMEFVDGRTLDASWEEERRHGDASMRRLIETFIKVALATGEAHSRGIVHRDLKPSNIRVDSRGEPRILDFGLARAMTAAPSRVVTTTGQILGSLPWASPEQAGGGHVAITPASDVYSIGVMLYQALTGRFPYPVEGSLLERLTHITNTVPRAPRSDSGCRSSRTLDQIVMRGLAKNPERRYANGIALGEALQSALQDGLGGPYRRRLRQVAVVAMVAGLCTLGITTGRDLPPLRVPTPQTVFQLPMLTNSVGMKLIRVPAGSFVMGSATGEDGQLGSAQRHLVTIPSPYCLGVTEVTQEQYQAVMHANPSDPRWIGPQMPVQQVTFQEANEFCRLLSQTEGRHYRLPSSAEWEYACRAGTTDRFSGSANLNDVGWYQGNSGGSAHAVAGKQPNAWGFYDCHGNVGEWCSDVGMNAPRESLAIIRGGSFLRSEADCRSAAYAMGSQIGRFNDVGFRVALDP